jgi:galactose oxidase
MGVLLQGFFKLAPGRAVPSPTDGDAGIPWWWDHLASQASSLRQAGFTAIWLPPVLKTASGGNPAADGYGTFDDYDIGSKSQKGSIPTRFGTREQLQRCVAVMRANGIDVYLDMVEHQRLGDAKEKPFVFRYVGADGAPGKGRFPKDPQNFVPQVPRDPHLGGPVADDFPFGRELAPINGKPAHFVIDNLIDAADWLTRTLDVQGYRIDDVKGLSTDFLSPFLNSRSMRGKFAVGEYFDGNAAPVNGWIFNPVGMKGRASAFDFPLKFMLNGMCNNPGRFDMASLDHAGLTGISPMQAVTFVENHDTDLNDGQKIVINKILAYAYILTSEGYPCVYYRDYSTDRDCFGLKPGIDNLIWIHENLAAGATQQRWKDFNVFAYERLGGPHLLVGLNNDPTASRTITVATGFGARTPLHDYTGHSPDVVTDGNGSATITIPVNRNGLGYVCYSRLGFGAPFTVTPLSVTQDFEGAEDLDVPALTNGNTIQVGRIWSAANAPVHANLTTDVSKWSQATAVTVEVLGPSGNVLSTQSFSRTTPRGTSLRVNTDQAGFHTLRLRATNLPDGAASYTLSTTYTAPRSLLKTAVANEAPAQSSGAADPKVVGKWSEVISLPNVPIHAHLLPTGKVLFWGRRKEPKSNVFATLNEHECFPFLWDPAKPHTSTPTKSRPKLANGSDVNLFCSGHTFLPDGRLLVIGGHLFDSQGANQACLYDAASDTWTATQTMNNGRWYPTAVTLPDGGVLASSGSFASGPLQPPKNQSQTNTIQQVWNNGTWRSIVDFIGLPLFPRMHVAPDGRVFMCGGNAESFFLDVSGGGTWVPGPTRAAGNRDYAPSVMYDVGKVIFLGGGLDGDTDAPTNIVEVIDLNSANPEWRQSSPMHFARRQHNATLLPDGTVLVTGGTQGIGFNNLDARKPVRAAEIWNPATGKWTVMAAEDNDRCYHSTAVLLPDGRVLSGGGGEYAPNLNKVNPAVDTHPDLQLFSPPYLFKGARPVIGQAPTDVTYGQTFDVKTLQAADIGSVSWVRLGSVTHSFDQNQRINFLAFKASAGVLSVTAPPNANVCPPGHYMLFILNKQQVPSVAAIIRIVAPVEQVKAALERHAAALAAAAQAPAPVTAAAMPSESDEVAQHNTVTVGITATCPYGISACWGGAYQALTHMQGVDHVQKTPDGDDSTVKVTLEHAGLPDVDLWRTQFTRIANGTHIFRGVEVTVEGRLTVENGVLTLEGDDERPPVTLVPIHPDSKIQWDFTTRALEPLEDSERTAYENLLARASGASGKLQATVTGPLIKTRSGFVIQVRKFVPSQATPTA